MTANFDEKEKSRKSLVLDAMVGFSRSKFCLLAAKGFKKKVKGFCKWPNPSRRRLLIKTYTVLSNKRIHSKSFKTHSGFAGWQRGRCKILNEQQPMFASQRAAYQYLVFESYSQGIYSLNNFKIISADCFWRID